MPRDFYEVLGVARDATSSQIQAGFESVLASTSGDPEAAAVEAKAREAFATLGNPESRTAYDQKLVIGEGQTSPYPRFDTLTIRQPRKKLSIPWLSAVCVASIAISVFCFFKWDNNYWDAIATASGLIFVYLEAVEHIWSWPISIVSIIATAIAVWQQNLLADASLQVVYFVLSIHGWYSWARGGVGRTALTISRMTLRHWILTVLSFVVGTALYKPVIEHFKGSQALFDTSLFVSSVVAQVLTNRKYIENWILWVIIDGAYVPLYLHQKLPGLAFLSAVFSALSLFGYFDWWRTLKTSLEPA